MLGGFCHVTEYLENTLVPPVDSNPANSGLQRVACEPEAHLRSVIEEALEATALTLRLFDAAANVSH